MTIGEKLKSRIDCYPYCCINILRYDIKEHSKESFYQLAGSIERSKMITLFCEELRWAKIRKIREYEF
jgi:hypothetical protein